MLSEKENSIDTLIYGSLAATIDAHEPAMNDRIKYIGCDKIGYVLTQAFNKWVYLNSSQTPVNGLKLKAAYALVILINYSLITGRV